MKKNFRFLALTLSSLLVCSVAFLGAGCSKKSSEPAPTGGDNKATPDKKIVLKLGASSAASHPEVKGAQKFAELVSQKTNGSVEVQVYDSAKLGDHKERLEGLRSGTVEITHTSVGFMATYDKIMTIFETPYLFKDKDHFYRVYDGQVGKEIADRLLKHGFRVLSFYDMGTRQITNSKRPVAKPEDLKGLKLRVPETKSSLDGFKALGASPFPMAFSEVYLALQQKVADGQENPFSIINSSKFYEVQPYLSVSNHQIFAQVSLISESAWQKLSKGQQNAVMEAANEALAYERQIMQDEEKNLLAELKNKGMKINEVDMKAFMEAAKPLKQQYINEYGDDAKHFFELIEKEIK